MDFFYLLGLKVQKIQNAVTKKFQPLLAGSFNNFIEKKLNSAIAIYHNRDKILIKQEKLQIGCTLPVHGTPPRTLRISGLKFQVLQPIFFELKMMVKRGID